MSPLPSGWKMSTVTDLALGGLFVDGDWVESKDQDPDGTVRLTQLADVGVGVFRDRSNRWMREDQADRMRCTFLQPNDVLIARMPDPIARSCVVPDGVGRAVTAVDVAILRPRAAIADPKYLSWYFNSPAFTTAAEGRQSGSTRKRISRRNLGALVVPIPPLREQRHIVAVLEDHLSRLDAADSDLGRARVLSQRLVRSTLQHLLRRSDTWEANFADVCEPAPVPPTTVPAREYQESGTWPVVDQGEGAIGGYTDERAAVYKGVIPALVFGDHTRRVKLVEHPFAVGAQGVRLLRPTSGVTPAFAYWTLTDLQLAGRGYGRHYALLRASRPRMASKSFQDVVVAAMRQAEETRERLAESLHREQLRSRGLRRALLTAAFTGRLTGRSSDGDVVEELVEVAP